MRKFIKTFDLVWFLLGAAAGLTIDLISDIVSVWDFVAFVYSRT